MTPRQFALPVLLALAACAPVPTVETARLENRIDAGLPPMKTFGGIHTEAVRRGNAELARDFLELSFRLESGRPLPAFTRFEGPVTVRVSGATPPTLGPDLDKLLARLRGEAGIDIRRTASGEANITIQTVPREELQRMVPQAACFVTPRVSSWAEFRSSRRGGLSDWTTLRLRETMAIFIPHDVAPQEIRDCLNEELAQALGPLNDLYRLPDSIFDDDNFYSVLTGFDMLMLRVTYAPELHSGMTEAQVAAVLPDVLARLNPAGGHQGIAPPDETPRAWIDAVETALSARTGTSRRRAAAEDATTMARQMGMNDLRRAFSLYVLGRLSISSDPDLALNAFVEAERIYRLRPETRVQAAHVSMQLAAYVLSSGRPEEAIRIADANLGAASQSQNAGLMAQLMLMKSTALDVLNRRAEAAVVRSEALGWARYGFGSSGEVRIRAGEIAALAPPRVASIE